MREENQELMDDSEAGSITVRVGIRSGQKAGRRLQSIQNIPLGVDRMVVRFDMVM
jgi:hypothetical protein